MVQCYCDYLNLFAKVLTAALPQSHKQLLESTLYLQESLWPLMFDMRHGTHQVLSFEGLVPGAHWMHSFKGRRLPLMLLSTEKNTLYI